MNRHDYLVTYDISDPRRLRHVFKTMKGFGEHIQLSVFRCSLNKTERIQMMAKLNDLINNHVDQVLIIHLGVFPERKPRIRPLGRPYQVAHPASRVL